MLSYRHAFHAGNHADVLKHAVLIRSLRLLFRKEKGILYVDSHAGAGSYALDVGYAAQNREWESGVDRLRRSDKPAPSLVQDYRDLVAASDRYPGSPAIAAALLRPQDRAVFCELHPTDAVLAAERFAADRKIKVLKEDGFSALKAVLPPPTRRGLVFIDPSYELTEDYERVADGLASSLRRFAEGVYVIWYPVMDRDEARALPGRLRKATEAATRPWLDARLTVATQNTRGMTGSGLFIVNPLWTLDEGITESLPYLTAVLGRDGGADWTIEAGQ